MTHVNLPSPGVPKPHPPASPAPQTQPEKTAAAAPSLRGSAGAEAPASLASSSLETMAIPHFEKRSAPAPEIPGLSALINVLNVELRPPKKVIEDLRAARAHFSDIRSKGVQTESADGIRTNAVLMPILHSENARTPGLNALGCSDENRMMSLLKVLSTLSHNDEGHVRFHLGVRNDCHRVAVDAFRHREGGFTLIGLDSVMNRFLGYELGYLQRRYPDIIKGTMAIPTRNQAHIEGCRIFTIHTLNAMHDFQPYIRNLHREIYDAAHARPAPGLSGPGWMRIRGTTHIIKNGKNSFNVLPGKFFKHMQVPKAMPEKTPTSVDAAKDRNSAPQEHMKKLDSEARRTLLDEAEDRNSALKAEPVNKKGQTLRQRFASLNPAKTLEEYSRADRTSSLDNKRLVLLDRAIAHYESLVKAAKPSP